MSDLGAGRKSSGGGGGGGGKSAADKLLEEQKREQTLWEHRRKMIQYEATRYQNAGELTNYSIMLGHESDEIERQLKLREEQLNALKKQMAATKKYSDDWYTLRDAILETEEAIAQLQNDYEELERTQEEVSKQILQMQNDIETSLHGAFEEQEQKRRDQLSATVEMQNLILEGIRERYRKEWELMQEDIDKKRQALEEEMALIDERLQRRKEAEDEAEKYEELSELKRQLALVSMDGSRTKDQAELRSKIADLEKEIAWDVAEDEAEAQKQSIQDKIDAYDKYETEYQKYLDEYLEDANNFTEEVNKVLEGSQEEVFAWLKENNEEFANSLAEQQEQMVINWTDTWNQMKGILVTYWAEIAAIITDKEAYLNVMMQMDQYQSASESGKEILKQQWSEAWDMYHTALKESEEAKNYGHTDPGDTSSTSGTSTYNPNSADYKTYYGGWQKQSDGSYEWKQGYGQGATQAIANSAAASLMSSKGLVNTATSTSGYPGQTIKPGTALPIPDRKQSGSSQISMQAYASGGYVDYTGLAMVHGSPSKPEAFLSAKDTEMMRSTLDSWHEIRSAIFDTESLISESSTEKSIVHAVANSLQRISPIDVRVVQQEASALEDTLIKAYEELCSSNAYYHSDVASTVLKDYGSSWIQSAVESWQYAWTAPTFTHIDNDYANAGSNVGDISISITEASFAEDADYEEVARRIGAEFTKELSRQGFRTSSFNF